LPVNWDTATHGRRIRRDLQAATRALDAELRVRDDAPPMTQAELDVLVDRGALAWNGR
jgi:hypothetical protein